MNENESIEIAGWIVNTKGPLSHYSGGHFLSGPRGLYEEFQFPVCPGCNIENSPIMQIDFSDKRLESLNLWDGLLVCMQCHNGCGMREKYGWSNYWWNYSNSKAPKILERDQIAVMEGRPPRNWEFESVEVNIIPRIIKKTNRIEKETQIGGEPAWIQNPLQQEIDVLCIECNRPMSLLFQWSETKMKYIPKGIGEASGAIMGNPGMSYWFGCKICRIVGQIMEFD